MAEKLQQSLLATPPTGVPKADSVPSTAICRICFEGGEDLIAPCRCAGTSKWIHRSCLNRWRISGSNPRSLTNCCECGFQYELELHRTIDLRSQEMRHQFTRQLLGHSLLWLVTVQFIIVALGTMIKLIDTGNKLVKFLPFERVAKVSGFFPTLQHYAFTYYVAGLIAFLLLIGLMVIGVSMCGFRPPMHECGACVEGCNMVCLACNPCDVGCCADIPFFGADAVCQCLFSASGPEVILLIGLFVAAAIVIIGLLAAVAALVMIIVRVAQRYVRLQEMGLLAEEYVVRDLSAPQPRSEDVVPQQVMEPGAGSQNLASHECKYSQEEIRKLVEEELRVVFGGALPPQEEAALRPGHSQGYGGP